MTTLMEETQEIKESLEQSLEIETLLTHFLKALIEEQAS